MTAQEELQFEIIHANFAPVRCGKDKRAIQKHSKLDYKKSSLNDIINNHKNGGNTAILTGSRSNNLEMMDFDLHNAENPDEFMINFERMVVERLGSMFIREMCRQMSPSGGWHWIYRTSKVEGNKKLSKGKNKQAIVETRGEGGYFVVAPSDGYTMIESSLDEVPVITPEQRATLWAIAKELEELVEPDIKRASIKKHSALSNENRSDSGAPNYWENFDNDCDYLTMLENDGWTMKRAKGSGNKYLMRRPNKTDDSWSADLELSGHGVPLLFVYTTSTALESEKAYTPSSYLIYYRFNGDAVKAYDWLIDNNYAPPRKVKEIKKMEKAPETKEEATGVFDKYAAYKIDNHTKFERPIPIITFNGVGILYTGELMTLSGEAKAGKSAMLSAIMAKVLNQQAQGFDIIKTEKTDYPILHFDTEQPIHRHSDNQKYHIIKRAGLKEFPKQLMSYNLRRMSVEDRQLMVSELIESVKIEYGGVFMVIIDGIADFIQDANDTKQSSAIVNWLLEISTTHNCGVINVIHLNPAPEGGFVKQRGHLGSELQRKTDTLIVVKKDGKTENSIITAQYLRNGGIGKFGEHRIRYDEETNMHQMVQDVEPMDNLPNQRYTQLTKQLAGVNKKDAIRDLVNKGVYNTLSLASKAVKELLDYDYMVEENGKLLSKGNLNAGEINLDAAATVRLIPIEEAEKMAENGKPPF